nr:RHS repeat-associated core domain-containing protein [Sedimenticola hydrogenitrophicus]
MPHGEYFLNVDDLSVKVLGGTVTARRTWYRGTWTFNRAWEPLKLEQDTVSGGVAVIERNGDRYAPESSGSTTYRFGRRYSIHQTGTGYRWQDRRGNWIDYDANGRILAYGDRNNIQVSFQFDAEGRRAAVLDHLGNPVLSYAYDTAGQLVFVRDKDNHPVEYRYSGGQLTEVIDVLGNRWRYSYSDGRMTSRTDAEGRVSTLSYNPTGRLLGEKDAEGIGSTYDYDYDKTKKQFYIRQVDPDNKLTERWYDSEGQLIRTAVNQVDTFVLVQDTQLHTRTSTDRRGLKTIKQYDLFDNLKQITYPDGSTVHYRYDVTTSQVTEKIDENGHITRYAYDPQGNLLQRIEAADTPQQRITEYRYDAYGRRIESKRLADAQTAEAITTYGYDAWGNLITLTDPEGQTTTFTHDARGQILTRTDPNNHTSQAGYDLAGRQLSRQDPLGHTTTIDYDKVGNPVTVTDAKNNVTQYGYDIRNLRTSVTDPLGHTSTLEYQLSGGLKLADAPLGNAKNLGVDTAFSYSPGGRLTATVDPLGNRQRLSYDAEGRLIQQTDAAGNVTALGYGDSSEQGGGASGTTRYPGQLNRIQYPTFLQTFNYDKRNRKSQTINHLGTHQEITKTDYDAAGNKTKSTDAEGRVTQYRYDALDRLIELIDPLGQSTRFQYDNRDNLLGVTDPNNHTTAYRYDKNNRKTREIRPGEQTISYTYDAAGNLIETLDPDGRKSTQTYDNANRLVEQKHYALGQTIPERTVSYSYDANGNLTGYSDGSLSASYQYDKNNRKTQETTNYGGFSLSYSYSYDAAGNKLSYTGPDGQITQYHWDKNRLQRIAIPALGSLNYAEYQWNRPKKLLYHGGGSRTIDYDPLLRPTRILALDPATNPLLDYQYDYDKTGNITQRVTEQRTYDYQYDNLQRLIEAQSPLETEGWDYDANGNRTADNLTPGSWSYDENDRLQTSPTTSYQYDQAGHTTQKTAGANTTKSIYNAEGRLQKVETDTGGLIGEYRYDPLGRRIQKTTPTETRYFHYTDEGLAGEYDSGGTAIQQYGYEPDGTWTTNPLYTKTDQGYAFYQTDHLGTPQRLVQSNGATVWAGEYRAFGEVTETNQAWANPLRFPGQYYDAETGTYYNYFRDYDPTIGRYVQGDPIGLGGGGNIFAYANNNPLMYLDEYGLIGKSYGKHKKRKKSKKPRNNPYPRPIPDPVKEAKEKGKAHEDPGVGIKGILCALGIWGCLPDDMFICTKWRCVPKCGDPYILERYSSEPVMRDPETPCVCIEENWNPEFDEPLPGL